MSTSYKALIFDLDNTLVTSNLDFKLIRKKIGCPQNVDIIAFIEALPKAERASKESLVQEIEIEEAQFSEPLPGAVELLEKLREKSIPFGIVTRNCRAAAQIKIKKAKLPQSTLIAREDAPAKPDPKALLMLSEQWQIAAPHMAYVGDYKYDLEAAINAGMSGVLLWRNNSQLPEYASMAEQVIGELNELSHLVV